MTEPIEDLDAEALALLAVYRDEERPPEAIRARVWARLEAAPPVHAVDDAPRPVRLRFVGLGLAAAAALVLGFLGLRGAVAEQDADDLRERPEAVLQHEPGESGGVAEHAAPRVPSKLRPATSERREPRDSSPIGSDEAELDGPQPSDTSEPRPPASPRPRAKPPAEEPRSPAETLAQETSLLKQARAALAADDHARALSLLQTHADRFGSGVLAEERDALRAVTLCSSGRWQDGRAAARAFSRRYPRSPLEGRVRSACDGEPGKSSTP
jgi:hypothetical protein